MTSVAPAEMMEMQQCRYCLEPDGDFVSPCQCSGTSRYVHVDCLNQWRHTNPNYRDTCRECGAHYFWKQTHYGETFTLCGPVSILIHYGCGALAVFSVAASIIIADPRADSSTIVEPVWGTNFTAELHDDTVLRIFYSVSFAGSVVYGTLWLVLIATMLTQLNNPATYFRRLGVWYAGCGVSSQCHFICIFGLGFYPVLALLLSSIFLLTLPLTFSQVMKRHDAYIASITCSHVVLADYPAMS